MMADLTRPEIHPAWPECPEPTRWRCWDEQSAEVEVADFLSVLVRLLKPMVVVETGTHQGRSTQAIAEGLRDNGRGLCHSIERQAEHVAQARDRLREVGLLQWVSLLQGDSLDLLPAFSQPIDLFFSDSDLAIRGEEIVTVWPKLSARAVIVAHDTSPHHAVVRRDLDRFVADGLLSLVHLPTPRGLTLARRRC